ncbi:SDR family oxidoreductase [Segetibacter sp.]|jgi:short-subunit dehydrogenase|uniref:SDR family NAD(P)-dependent oxidoreductase n=1 Tax=Segetibacter sp. TaxID=2231182 RepID=UPI0026282251|nr:SDR family oxidoreductase [Segetibacter sp.]MCW3079010.1 family NAD(P)-dependent oxidoreductase [Segetibacter sp.]
MNVIITGATKGMGRAIAEQFAAAGYNIVACARTESDLQEMKSDFLTRFPAVLVTSKAVNIGDAGQVKQFGKWILESHITPDVLVNNAGYFVPGTIHDEKDGTIEKMMEVNVYSSYHLSRSLIPVMMERKQGHIFNICSIAAFQPLPNVGSYGISKFALLGLTKHLREEMKPYGIKVTAVLPGATFSGSWEGSDIDPQRIMEANDVAKMVFASSQLSPMAVVEDIILRPQLGDL